MRKNSAALAALLALGVLLIWGLEQAAVAPLETGDVYPAYSSLRTDPLGAKALYESFAMQPGMEVNRLYKQRAAIGVGETMLVLGVEPVAWSGIEKQSLEEYEKLVAGGGRLVIGFLPVRSPRRMAEKREIESRWDIKFLYGLHEDDSGGAIPRDTALSFEAGPEWRAIPNHAAVERTFGKGTIVLAADTFSLSNEGLREARDAEFAGRLIGPSKIVTFDENHFGVVETGSVTKLMRKYHLEGAVAMLALAAALFLWRSASSFLPPREASRDEAVSGRGSMEAMAALLRRGIPERDLIDACFTEWSRGGRVRRASLVEERIRELKNDVPAAYRAAARALTEKS